jgi:hypothetical protein
MRCVARAAWLLLLGACILPDDGPLARYEFDEPHMGTTVRIVFYASSPELAQRGRQAAFAVMKNVDDLMSDYKPDSELSRLSRAAGKGPQPVSQPLFDVLETSLRLRELSRDVRRHDRPPHPPLAPVAEGAQAPFPEEIRAARVDYRKLVLDRRSGRRAARGGHDPRSGRHRQGLRLRPRSPP